MAGDKALLNVDANFIYKPELIGNQYVSRGFVGHSDVKTNILKYMEFSNVTDKLQLKRKYVGQITSSTEQVLAFYQRLVDKNVVEPKKFKFVHIGSHCNIYSWGGHVEYETKDEIHNYEAHNAFAYLFVKKYIDNIIWVHPDHYDEHTIDAHFAMMDTTKRNGFHIISINQGLRFLVKPVRWSDFKSLSYDWKAITVIANKLTANFNADDLVELKSLIY